MSSIAGVGQSISPSVLPVLATLHSNRAAARLKMASEAPSGELDDDDEVMASMWTWSWLWESSDSGEARGVTPPGQEHTCRAGQS